MAPITYKRVDPRSLQPGQQVAFFRREGVATFYHHVIVELSTADFINAIERVPDEIRREVHDDLSNDPPYLITHSSGQKSYSEVLARAKRRLGEAGFDLATMNCEHFANWCSTGVDRSYQAEEKSFGIALVKTFYGPELKRGKTNKF